MDAERLLGALLRNGMRRGTTRSAGGFTAASRGAVGMGLLGVAVAAFDHFVRDRQTGAGDGGRDAPQPTPPPAPSPLGAPAPPPPPPPPRPHAAGASPRDDAILLIRAMISAANADGVIDEQERREILAKLDASGVGNEERMFLLTELLAPKSLETIVADVDDLDLARMVYTASRCAIRVDTDAEQDYLDRLARALGLSDQDRADIDGSLG